MSSFRVPVKKATDLSYSYIADYNERIQKMCGNTCKHSDYYGYNNNGHLCSTICKTIYEALDNGIILANDTIQSVICCFLKNDKHSRDIRKCCLHANGGELVPVLNILFGQYMPIPNDFARFITYMEFDNCYNSFTQIPTFAGLSDEYLNIAVANRLRYSLSDADNELVAFILKHIDINEDNIYQLCGCMNHHVDKLLSGYIDKFNGSLCKYDYMSRACEALPYTKNIINSLIGRGSSIRSEHLTIVCSKCDTNAIDFILQKTRLTVTREHYNALLTCKQYVKQNPSKSTPYSSYYRYTPPNPWIDGYSAEKMELLIKHGYKLDYTDICESIKKKVVIPGIERFDIPLDEKILELCYANEFYPPYNFSCIKPEMLELQNLCLSRRTVEIKKLIKAHNLVPDKKCMENASTFRANILIYDFLVANGGKPTYKCITNCANLLKDNRYLTRIITDYGKIHDSEIQTYQDKIKDLENLVIQLGGTLPQNNAQTNVNIVDTNIDNADSVDDMDNVDNTDNDDCDDSDDSETEDINDGNIDELGNNQNFKIHHIDMDDETMAEIQRKYKAKSQLTPILLQLFKLDKRRRPTYGDVKQLLLSKIRDEKWINEHNKTLINPPQNIKNKLGMQEDEFIEFGELDKLICKLYS